MFCPSSSAWDKTTAVIDGLQTKTATNGIRYGDDWLVYHYYIILQIQKRTKMNRAEKHSYTN